LHPPARTGAGRQGVFRGQSVCPPPPHLLRLQEKSKESLIPGRISAIFKKS
jgi:hypothetical protein